MSDRLECSACGRNAIAVVASGDAAVDVADGFSECEVSPDKHSGTGFRHYVHAEE